MSLERLCSIVAETGALPVGFFEHWKQDESAQQSFGEKK
jgi:hypothetical protein